MVDVTVSVVAVPWGFRSVFGRKTRGEPARPTVGAQQRYLGAEYSAIQLDRFGRVVTPTVPGQPPLPPPTPGGPPTDTGVGDGGFLFAGPGTAWWGQPVASREDRVRRAPPEFPYDLLWQFRSQFGIRTEEYGKRILDAEKFKRKKLRDLELREKFGAPRVNTLVAQAGAPDVPGAPDVYTGSIFRAVLRALWPFVSAAIKGSKPKPPPAPVEEPQVGEIDLPEPEEVPKELEREAERAAELGRPLILGTTKAIGVRIPRPSPVADRPARAIPEALPAPAPAQMPGRAPGRAPVSAPSPVAKPSLPRPASTGVSPLGVGALAATGFLPLSSPSRVTSRSSTPRLAQLQAQASTPIRGSIQSTVTAALSSSAPQRAPARSRKRECEEVKRRRRKKGKCREGYFVETSGSTTYTYWRERDCLTGEVISDSKEKEA